ncbi:MAG: DUF2791 family P-loop domain-containing protein, partial [Candidatus Thermoplasmatota archaeon]|nr:DUF2791 family P-loop domain-containing protein [Candidatus Thermoplasmatota archaeon]
MPENIFVGREEELKKLDALMEKTASGNGHIVMVFGEQGVGKTSLVQHFAAQKGVALAKHVIKGHEKRPFASFTSLLKSMKKDGWDVDQALKILTSTRTATASGAAKDQNLLFQNVSEALRDGCTDASILLMGNMHMADSESIKLFSTLARDVHKTRILLVGTYIMEELGDRDGKSHPLVESMGELMMEDNFSTIELGLLGPSQLEEIIVAMLQGEKPPKRFVVSLYSTTKGNPLFIKEVLVDLMKKGIIDPKDPNWARKVNLDALSMPSSLRDATKQALSELHRDERTVLELMSIMGISFQEPMAAQVTGLESEKVFDVLLKLAGKRLVDEVGGHYTLHHPYIADAVLESMNPTIKMEMHRKVASIMEKEGMDEFLVGHQALQGELWDMAAKNLLKA